MHNLLPLLLLQGVAGSTALPDGWDRDKDLAPGECSADPAGKVSGEVAVGSSGEVGRECGAAEWPPMPGVYVAAVSAALLHGRESGSTCGQQTEEQAMQGIGGCASGCGECIAIDGPAGSGVWRVTGLLDTAGLAVRVSNGSAAGLQADPTSIQLRRVACPTTGPLEVAVAPNSSPSHASFQVLNHRTPIAAFHIRFAGTSTWTPLPRTSDNTFMWAPQDVAWQTAPLPTGAFDVRLVGVGGERYACTGWRGAQLQNGARLACGRHQFLCPASVEESCRGAPLPVSPDAAPCDPTTTPPPPPSPAPSKDQQDEAKKEPEKKEEEDNVVNMTTILAGVGGIALLCAARFVFKLLVRPALRQVDGEDFLEKLHNPEHDAQMEAEAKEYEEYLAMQQKQQQQQPLSSPMAGRGRGRPLSFSTETSLVFAESFSSNVTGFETPPGT